MFSLITRHISITPEGNQKITLVMSMDHYNFLENLKIYQTSEQSHRWTKVITDWTLFKV